MESPRPSFSFVFKETRYSLSLTCRLVPAGAGAGIQLTTSSKEGAVLLLPQGASRTDTRKIPRFARYAIKHGLDWYKFANEEDFGLENGSLYLVTGCDKASAWGVASFYNASTEGEISLKFTAAQVASGRVSCAWKWETYSPASVRSGPIRAEGEEQRGKNQCVFVRGLKVAISDSLWTRKTGIKVSPMKGTPPNSSSPTSKSGFASFSGEGGRLPFLRRQDSEGRDRCKDDPDGQSPSSSAERLDDTGSVNVKLDHVPEVAKVCIVLYLTETPLICCSGAMASVDSYQQVSFRTGLCILVFLSLVTITHASALR